MINQENVTAALVIEVQKYVSAFVDEALVSKKLSVYRGDVTEE